MLLFLNGVSAVDAQLLNPVKNYCARYDHQCKGDCSADLLSRLTSATLSHGKGWSTVYFWRRSNVRGFKQLRYRKQLSYRRV